MVKKPRLVTYFLRNKISLAPIYSNYLRLYNYIIVPIVRDLLENHSSVENVKLIYGVNKESEFIYDAYFQDLAGKYSNFEYLKTVAVPEESWTGHRGFVTDVMNTLSLDGYKVYMCGPKPMINATMKTLQQKGIKKENIAAESA